MQTKGHEEKVRKLQKALVDGSGHISLQHHGDSNTLRHRASGTQLDLSDFKDILEFNPAEKSIVVEPRITFLELSRFTLKHGLMPPVVPEFTSITVGGAIMGAAIESSSHKYGQVCDQCIEYELLLGNGERVLASKENHSDLFYAISGSYGTLALLTAIKLKLIPTKPYVQLKYEWHDNVQSANQALLNADSDFVEGIVFSPSRIVVIKGNMADTTSQPLYRQKHFWSTWFTQHVERAKKEDAMTLEEYLFRHDRGAFWIGRYILSISVLLRLFFHLGIPQILKNPPQPNGFFRLLFGWTFPSRKLYRFWHRIPSGVLQNLFFIHDFYAPAPHSTKILTKMIDEIGIFPIWLCPVKGTTTEQFLSPHFGQTHYLNIGLYGACPPSVSIPKLTAIWEKKIVQEGGRKMLYSFTYYDPETFDQIYQAERYNQLRKKFFAERAFPSLYNKVTNNSNF